MLLLALAAFAQDAPEPEPAAKPKPWQRDGWGGAGLPALNFNSDEGFGFGVIGSVYRYDGQTAPYKTAINGLVFFTTKAIQNHRIDVDALGLAGGKLRLNTRLQFDITVTDNYCGFGGEVTCSPDAAIAEADQLVFENDEDREDFLRRYYRYRYIRPNGFVTGRWMFKDKPGRIEAFGGWRGEYFLAGDLTSSEPYPGSLYAQSFPEGETGLLSVLQAGMSIDDRDNEPAPIRGYWVEASIRGATVAWGSAWDYFGFNTTLRGYTPVGYDRLVFANRFAFDGMVGDAPHLEFSKMGGVAPPSSLYGGLNGGRGIRQRRFVGRIKALEQPELRWTFLDTKVIDLGILAFTDFGLILADWEGTDDPRLILGHGGGLRVALEDNFVVRADVGVSAEEDYSASVYIDVNNLF